MSFPLPCKPIFFSSSRKSRRYATAGEVRAVFFPSSGPGWLCDLSGPGCDLVYHGQRGQRGLVVRSW